MSTARLAVQPLSSSDAPKAEALLTRKSTPPSARDGLAHIAAHRVALGKVGAGGMGLAAELGDLRPCLLERLGIAGADRDVAAAGREAQRDRPADAPAAAADDGLLAREIDLHHQLSLFTAGRTVATIARESKPTRRSCQVLRAARHLIARGRCARPEPRPQDHEWRAPGNALGWRQQKRQGGNDALWEGRFRGVGVLRPVQRSSARPEQRREDRRAGRHVRSLRREHRAGRRRSRSEFAIADFGGSVLGKPIELVTRRFPEQGRCRRRHRQALVRRRERRHDHRHPATRRSRSPW